MKWLVWPTRWVSSTSHCWAAREAAPTHWPVPTGYRVAGVAIIAGLGPTTEDPAVRRMGRAARLAFALARRTPVVFKLAYGGLAQLVARYPGLNFYLNEAMPPDREVLAVLKVRSTLEASIQKAFRGGTAGAIHELALLAHPWGFRVEEISTPVGMAWTARRSRAVPDERIARRENTQRASTARRG